MGRRGGVQIFDPAGLAVNLSHRSRLVKPTGGPAYFGGHATLGEGLLHCWEMDDNAESAVVVDCTGNQDATYRFWNGSAYDCNTNLGDDTGLLDGALKGYALGSYRMAVNFTAIESSPGDVIDNDQSFSFSLWYYQAAFANGDAFIDTTNFGSTGIVLRVKDASRHVAWEVKDGSNVFGKDSDTDQLTNAAWNHLGVSHAAADGETSTENRMALYLNGSDVGHNLGQAGMSGSFASSYLRLLGFLIWDGKLDQTALWGRVLTGDEWSDLYNSGSGLRCAPA